MTLCPRGIAPNIELLFELRNFPQLPALVDVDERAEVEVEVLVSFPGGLDLGLTLIVRYERRSELVVVVDDGWTSANILSNQ